MPNLTSGFESWCEMTHHIKFLREQGIKGGKAGKGKSKVRGDSKYYRALAKKRRLSHGDDSTTAKLKPKTND